MGGNGSPIQITSPASLIGSRYMDGEGQIYGCLLCFDDYRAAAAAVFEELPLVAGNVLVLDFSAALIMGQEIVYEAAHQRTAPR